MSTNATTASKATNKAKGIQQKWMVDGTFEGEPTRFGPYDSAEKADKSLPVLTDAGLQKAKVVVIYTCSSVSEFARQHTPKTETTPVSPAPAPEAPKPSGRRGRQSAKA